MYIYILIIFFHIKNTINFFIFDIKQDYYYFFLISIYLSIFVEELNRSSTFKPILK